MLEPLKQAQTYRYRAEALRAMVGEWRNPQTLSVLRDLANDYDRMADNLEQRVKATDESCRMIERDEARSLDHTITQPVCRRDS